jgi:hypothetical protein
MKGLRVFGVPVALCAALAGGGASAATVDVAVTGACDGSRCGNLGMAFGDAFAGTVGVDLGTFAPNAIVSGVASYSFVIGSFAMTDADEVISNNLVEWGETADAINAIYIFAFASDNPEAPAAYLSLTAIAGADGSGYAAPDAFFNANEFSEGNGALLAVNPIGAAPIPLPAGGSLILGALVFLGLLRRRTA